MRWLRKKQFGRYFGGGTLFSVSDDNPDLSPQKNDITATLFLSQKIPDASSLLKNLSQMTVSAPFTGGVGASPVIHIVIRGRKSLDSGIETAVRHLKQKFPGLAQGPILSSEAEISGFWIGTAMSSI
jgi:hypothetical protein